jgi:uncharacterized membrane protein YkoI
MKHFYPLETFNRMSNSLNSNAAKAEGFCSSLKYTTEKHESEVHVDAVTGEVFKVTEGSGKVSTGKNAMLTSAKVSFDEAEAAALARVSGAVVFAALEKERGKVLYEFEIIVSDGKESTVHVDTASGQIEKVEQD